MARIRNAYSRKETDLWIGIITEGTIKECASVGNEPHVIYLDIFLIALLANFAFDWLLLWATAEVTRHKTTKRRLMAGAAVGTMHFGLYVLAAQNVIGYYGLLRFPVTLAVVSMLMLIITFPTVRWRAWLRLAGTFYVVFFISAGAGLAAGNILGGVNNPHLLISILAAIGTLLIVAELGWGVIQRRLNRQLYHVPIEITCDSTTVQLIGLIDTGHSLADPLTGAPVIVAEGEALRPLFPIGLQPDLASLAAGDLTPVSSLTADSNWATRFRMIPFSSLGQSHGLLAGFKADRVRLLLPEPVEVPTQTVIALSDQRLDPSGAYRALLPPVLLRVHLTKC